MIPEDTIEVMISSLSVNTIKQYSVALNKWWIFCKGENIFDVSITKILEFLTDQFKTGSSYTSLNTTRSALSLILSCEIGIDPQIKRFFKGIFKLRPSRPKYNDTWDPAIVLNHIEKWYPLQDLSFLKLTKKLVMLLALTSAQRIQTLSLIRLNNIQFVEAGVNIEISDLLKTSKPGKQQMCITLPYFLAKPEICPVTTLQYYINYTKTLRKVEFNNTEMLLISVKKPYNYASRQTISRWIKQTMKDSGIDIKRFTPHSTRHAATSRACREGVTLDTIFRSAGWSIGSKVFANHYNRPLIKSNDKYIFAKTVCNIESH